MKCISCGNDFEGNYETCPNCKAPMNPPATVNPVAQWSIALFKDKLFLLLCVLMSVSCGLDLIDKTFPLFTGLIAAFLWVVFAQAHKNIANTKFLRAISGTVFAQHIFLFVLAGLIALIGVLITLILSLASGAPDLINEILAKIGTVDGIPTEAVKVFISTSGSLILMTFILVAGALALINLLFLRPAHQLAKSVYQCIDKGVWELQKAGVVTGWLWVIGIINGVDTLFSLPDGDILGALSSATLAGSLIITAILLGRYNIPILPIKNDER